MLKQKKRKHQNYKMEELANSSNPKILVNTQELIDKKGGVQIYKNCLFQSANYRLCQNLHLKPDSDQYSEIQRNTLKVLDEQDNHIQWMNPLLNQSLGKPSNS